MAKRKSSNGQAAARMACARVGRQLVKAPAGEKGWYIPAAGNPFWMGYHFDTVAAAKRYCQSERPPSADGRPAWLPRGAKWPLYSHKKR